MSPSYPYTRSRIDRVRRQYGLSAENLFLLHDTQGGGDCAICRKPSEVVDHRHSDGEVRGLLCNLCNLGLGHFRDSPKLLEAAIRYLAPDWFEGGVGSAAVAGDEVAMAEARVKRAIALWRSPAEA
jgi:hypothetical protein